MSVMVWGCVCFFVFIWCHRLDVCQFLEKNCSFAGLNWTLRRRSFDLQIIGFANVLHLYDVDDNGRFLIENVRATVVFEHFLFRSAYILSTLSIRFGAVVFISFGYLSIFMNIYITFDT